MATVIDLKGSATTLTAMELVPVILLLVAVVLVATAQLVLQTDQFLLTLLLVGPVLPAVVMARLRLAPGRFVAVRVRDHDRQGSS